jgi:REP element-mobilizing transposase RayT
MHRTPVLEERSVWVTADTERMKEVPYFLDHVRREIVMETIRCVCRHRGWNPLAVHVRTSHVHVVVEADEEPERVLNDFKSYASRRLNEVEPERRRWARHGSTRWLWNPKHVSAAMQYVFEEQGEPMERYSPESEPRP